MPDLPSTALARICCALAVWAVGFAGCTPREASDGRTLGKCAQPVVSQAAPLAGDSFVIDEGFRLLGLNDFEFFYGSASEAENSWSADGTVIRCSGTPRGYAFTKRSFRNFNLRLDYRFAPRRARDAAVETGAYNTGVLIYVTGAHKLWPVSLEVQGKHSAMAAIKANGGAAPVDVDDDDQARREARFDVGQWNGLEIVSHEGSLTSYLNGRRIGHSQAGDMKEGRIGLQAESFEVHFRHVRIREDD